MAPKQLFHALSQDFENLLNNRNFSDIRIFVGRAPYARTFHAHSQILATRSLYFARALSNDNVKRENNNVILANPNISPRIFEVILRNMEKIVKWGCAKLGDNIKAEEILNWTYENFDILKKSIKELLPLIRHQKSVDAQPLRCPRLNIGSKLLQWDNSRDGFTPADFHRLCDNKGATISVIKVKETGELIGGYNPEYWHSRHEYLDGKGSLIFSLGDGKPENAKFGIFIGKYGAFSAPSRGPEFSQHSIVMESDDFQNGLGSFCQKDSSYEHVIMPGSENREVLFFCRGV
ncbi:hypothetical protein G9A89_019088 [Geosiphon pyriformis]|nr:hypothetical protein G9A89_019088 [Geosiphon pyriformis]